jgi:NAD-dependent SIR2 family protein deacetylase
MLPHAASLLSSSSALLITAGAGMGVDSGLPDFRGVEGFWRAYPALGRLKLSFDEMAQPGWFASRPEMAWAFYGHRQQLYRDTVPHPGFQTLLRWGNSIPCGYFVATSNVDGQFQKAGFPTERILEVHGNIHRLQCTQPCSDDFTWVPDAPLDLRINLESLTAHGRLPRCPRCGAMARPNVLMFNDVDWSPEVTLGQERRFRQWLASTRGQRLVVLELGAGTAVATIRRLGERLVAERDRTTLVRINPDVRDEEPPVVPVRLGAAEAIARIDCCLLDQPTGRFSAN